MENYRMITPTQQPKVALTTKAVDELARKKIRNLNKFFYWMRTAYKNKPGIHLPRPSDIPTPPEYSSDDSQCPTEPSSTRIPECDYNYFDNLQDEAMDISLPDTTHTPAHLPLPDNTINTQHLEFNRHGIPKTTIEPFTIKTIIPTNDIIENTKKAYEFKDLMTPKRKERKKPKKENLTPGNGTPDYGNPLSPDYRASTPDFEPMDAIDEADEYLIDFSKIVTPNIPKQYLDMAFQKDLPDLVTKTKELLQHAVETSTDTSFFDKKDGHLNAVFTRDTNCSIDHNDVSTDTNDKCGWEFFKIEDRLIVNKLARNIGQFKGYNSLVYHLKIKFFMKMREPSLINTMITEARNYLVKHDIPTNTRESYDMLTHSVIAAFIVDKQELIFREILKEPLNIDSFKHLNETLSGNLGKTARTYRESNSLLNSLPWPKSTSSY